MESTTYARVGTGGTTHGDHHVGFAGDPVIDPHCRALERLAARPDRRLVRTGWSDIRG